MMVEGEMNEVQEHDLVDALKAAQQAIIPMCELQDELAKELGTDVLLRLPGPKLKFLMLATPYLP